MILVTVKLFNILADYAGSRQVELDLPPEASVLDVLRSLCSRFPPGFEAIVLPGGVPGSYLKIFHNGSLVDKPAGECILSAGDELMLFPAVAGGSSVESGL